jgi:hypothetical protein
VRKAALIATLGLLVGAASATASTRDGASAHTGLRAYRAYLSSLVRKIDVARRNDEAFIAAVRAKCPHVLDPVTASDTFTQGVVTRFGKEAGTDLVLSAFAAFREPLATLSIRLGRLQWSKPAIGRQLKRGRTAVPFLSKFQHEAADTGKADPKRILLRYRRPGDRRLARVVERLEDRADTRPGDVLTAKVPKLLKALGLFV